MLRPLKNRVLIEVVQSETKTAGGIHIPQTAENKQHKGTVRAVAKDVETIAVNDLVIFGQYAGTEVKIDGKAMLLVAADDVLAVLELSAEEKAAKEKEKEVADDR